MDFKDIGSIVFLLIGLTLAIIWYVLVSRGVLKPKIWPRVLAIGAGAFAFPMLMIFSIFSTSKESIINYTATNCLLTTFLVSIAYISGRLLQRRSKDR